LLCNDSIAIILQTGLPFNAEYEARLDTYLAANTAKRVALKAKKGSAAELHSYSLEEYGLSTELVQEVFADYIAEYRLDQK
jgi:hypothetical protein